MRQAPRHPLTLLLVATLVALGCSGDSPSEPRSTVTQSPAATAAATPVEGDAVETPGRVRLAARGVPAEAAATSPAGESPALAAVAQAAPATLPLVLDEGQGGNGGGRRPPKKPKPGDEEEPIALEVRFQPDVWNVRWERARGNVSALVRGTGVAQIDPGSLLLVGPAGDTLAPRRVQGNRHQLRAFFDKADALALIPDPRPGETYELVLELVAGDAPFALVGEVRIVGPGGDDEPDDGEDEEEDEPPAGVRAIVQPSTWNLRWARSSGTFSIKIVGRNAGDVDPDSLELEGPEGDVITPLRVRRQGNHLRAVFGKADGIGLLDDPRRGETYELLLHLEVDGDPGTIPLEIRIVGPHD